MSKYYDAKYDAEDFFWGKQPSSIARILFQKHLPREGQGLLDIGCGEGRDSVFFARNGYRVRGFDSAVEGVTKASEWAKELGLSIDFFQADINEYRLQEPYDVVYASGALQYIPSNLRDEILSNYKHYTNSGGIHAFTVPIYKAFLPKNPKDDENEQIWHSGEILTHYHDWKIDFFVEQILDDPSGFKFPVNRLIAIKPSTWPQEEKS